MISNEQKVEKLKKAQRISLKIHQLCEEEEPDMRIAFLGAMIFVGSAARMMGLSLHATIDGLMAIYKDTDTHIKKGGGL